MIEAQGSHYANMYGFWKYGKELSSTVRVVCRTGFLIPHMMPLDFEATEAVCHQWCKPMPGSEISANGLAVMVFAHAIKWNGAVQKYEEALPRQACMYQNGNFQLSSGDLLSQVESLHPTNR